MGRIIEYCENKAYVLVMRTSSCGLCRLKANHIQQDFLSWLINQQGYHEINNLVRDMKSTFICCNGYYLLQCQLPAATLSVAVILAVPITAVVATSLTPVTTVQLRNVLEFRDCVSQ